MEKKPEIVELQKNYLKKQDQQKAEMMKKSKKNGKENVENDVNKQYSKLLKFRKWTMIKNRSKLDYKIIKKTHY